MTNKEALNDSEFPNNSDMVSRQAVLDAVNRAVTKEAARWSIKELPSAEPEILACGHGELIVEPERKTGRWERHYSRPNVYADLWWYCSVCGYKNDNQLAWRYHHYCPNCGAKMEVEHE